MREQQSEWKGGLSIRVQQQSAKNSGKVSKIACRKGVKLVLINGIFGAQVYLKTEWLFLTH